MVDIVTKQLNGNLYIPPHNVKCTQYLNEISQSLTQLQCVSCNCWSTRTNMTNAFNSR